MKRYIIVQPAIDNCVPEMEANTWGAPPLIDPKSRVEVVEMLWPRAYRLPSRETFDQGYRVYGFSTLFTAAVSLVRRVSPDPSTLTFHQPERLVSTPPPLTSIGFLGKKGEKGGASSRSLLR